MASTVQLIMPRRGHVPGAPVGFYPVGTAFLLDALGVSAGAAFAVRLLTSTYLGNCCNVRRSSDNATQDIGFTSSGDFDSASFSSFVGAGSGFVTKWYDQSGNARDATQATAASQPQFVLNTIGGRAALKCGGSQSLATASFASQPATGAINAVMERTGAFSSQANALLAVNLVLGFAASANTALFGLSSSMTASASDSVAHSLTGVIDGASSVFNVDGAQTTSTQTSSGASGAFVIGGSGVFLVGNMSEVILLTTTALSNNQQSTVHSDQSSYYGTP